MKKYLFSTLVAAAAMAVPALAGGSGTLADPYTGAITDLDLSYDEETGKGWAAGSTVYINGVAPTTDTGSYFANSGTNAMSIVANVDIGEGGLSLNNAYSGVVYTFSGAITGDGNWTFTGGTSTPTQHYIFTGDLSKYSGNFSMTAGSSSNSEGYLQFGDGGKAATNTAVSGTGSITTSSSGSGFAVIYNYGSLASGSEDAITISNSSITTEDLQFTGSVNYSVSSVLAGYNSNAKLTISNAGTTTFNGNVSGFGTITVSSGSTLAVGSGATLDLSGTTVDLASAIQNSGTVIVNESTVFVLDGLTATTGSLSTGEATYTLVSGSTGTIQLGDGSGTVDSLGTSNVSSSDFTITGATFTVDSGTLSVTVSTGGYTDGLHGSGSVSSPYFTTGGTAETKTTVSFDVNNFTGKGTTLYLATDTYSFGNAYENIYWSSDVNAECDIVIGAAGIYLTNGSSGNVHTFSGAISGTGNWTVSNESGAGVTQQYVFTGDMSKWSGNFSITTTSTGDYVYFGNGGTAATNTSVSGASGSIAVDYGTVRYNYSGYADGTATSLTVTNSSIEAHTIIFTGGVNYDVSAELKGYDANGATGSTLEISTAGTVTASGKVSGFDIVTVASGSTLAVGSTGSLDLSGATVNIGSTIQNAGTITIDSSTSFVIDTKGLTSTGWSDGSATYTLIASGGKIEGYSDSISISSNVYGATYSVSCDGYTLKVTFTDNTEATGLHGSGESDHAYYTTGTGSSGIVISTSIFTGKGTTVYLASETQSLGNASENVYWTGGNFTAECDIVIGAAGIYLTNGNSGNQHIFTGAISGTGNWTVTGDASDNAAKVNQDYTFTGDLSQWSGNFTITTVNIDDYVYFGNGGTAATNTSVSGASGSIAVDYGTVRYNYSGYADDTATSLTVTNSSIEAHQIVFAGGVNYDVSSSLIGYDGQSTATTGSTLTISTAGTVTVRGSVSDFDSIVVSSGSGLTVASGASVTLKSGSTLSVAGGATLTLNTAITADGATVSFSENASLVLTDAFLASAIESASVGPISTFDANDAVTITIITASAINYNGTDLSSALDDFVSIVSTSDNYLLSNWTYSEGTLSVDVTYLPEPSMFGVFAGLSALGMMATRRRRRKVA